MQASIRELNNHLSAYIQRAQQGEEIVVTSHNYPVAKIVSVEEPVEQTQGKRKHLLKDLEALDKKIGKVKGKPLSQTVIAARDQERY